MVFNVEEIIGSRLSEVENALEEALLGEGFGPLVGVEFTLETGDSVIEYFHPSEIIYIAKHPKVGNEYISAKIIWDGINSRAWDTSI